MTRAVLGVPWPRALAHDQRLTYSQNLTIRPLGKFRGHSLLQHSALWYRKFGPPERSLSLESHELALRASHHIRVRMGLCPINPSDLVPIAGAYRHRVELPRIAGYEGVGTVVEAEGAAKSLTGSRVLPLRGPGTWQTLIDCEPEWAVPVPDDIEDSVAARAYINPLAAMLMLRRWDPNGKRLLITAAGSSCANLLVQWALAGGAREIAGIYRSGEHRLSLFRQNIHPIPLDNAVEVLARSKNSDLVFDAVGGPLASAIQHAMRKDGEFVSYGLLSGQMIEVCPGGPSPQRFHIRDQLEALTPATWQSWFREIWSLLRTSAITDTTSFPLSDWRNALDFFQKPGRSSKPLLCLEDLG